MGGKRRHRRHKKSKKGKGKVWNGIKKVGRKVHNFLKGSKLLSKYGDKIPVIGDTVKSVAEAVGYGKLRYNGGRRRRRHRIGKVKGNTGFVVGHGANQQALLNTYLNNRLSSG